MAGFSTVKHRSGNIRAEELPGGLASGYATSIGEGDPLVLNAGVFNIAAPGGTGLTALFRGIEYTGPISGKRIMQNYWTGGTAANDIIVHYENVDEGVTIEVEVDSAFPADAVGKYGSYALNTPSVYGKSGAKATLASLNASAANKDFRVTKVIPAFGTEPAKAQITPIRANNQLLA